ncbi:unnamed protein product [Aphanomyces euteiches]|nr:hypothetical protein AeRB84_012235 [Aphanomyces euteiches]
MTRKNCSPLSLSTISCFLATVLFVIERYDFSIVSSVTQQLAVVQANFPLRSSRQGQVQSSTSKQLPCRVQFVFAGPKYDYNQFPNLQSWIRYTDSKCSIEFLRPNHPFLNQLTTAESRMFYDMAHLPILQADMLKLFALYYLGGIVADLDVEPIKQFPQAWSGADTPFATCDVVLGIETACYDDICVKNYVRKGQIQNWAMFARRRRSPFLGELVRYIIKKYDTFPRHRFLPVQEVAGSGCITDFVAL